MKALEMLEKKFCIEGSEYLKESKMKEISAAF
jgi:hypothetical protein